MLVLSRRVGEKIVIGDGIVVTVVEVHRDSVRLGVDAPRSITVNRAELLKAVSEENVAAMSNVDDNAALTSLKGIRPKGNSPLDLKKLMRSSSLSTASKPDTNSTDSPTPNDKDTPSPKDVASKVKTPKPAPPVAGNVTPNHRPQN